MSDFISNIIEHNLNIRFFKDLFSVYYIQIKNINFSQNTLFKSINLIQTIYR